MGEKPSPGNGTLVLIQACGSRRGAGSFESSAAPIEPPRPRAGPPRAAGVDEAGLNIEVFSEAAARSFAERRAGGERHLHTVETRQSIPVSRSCACGSLNVPEPNYLVSLRHDPNTPNT